MRCLPDPLAARRFAQRMVAAGGSRPDRPVQAGDIDAMGLIHEIQHLAIAHSAARAGDRPFAEILQSLAAELGPDRLDATLAFFEDAFPAAAVYGGALRPDEYLDGTTDGSSNREVALEELLLLWVANQNPAFMGYQELFDDGPLRDRLGLRGRGAWHAPCLCAPQQRPLPAARTWSSAC